MEKIRSAHWLSLPHYARRVYPGPNFRPCSFNVTVLPYSIALSYLMTADARQQDLLTDLPLPPASNKNAPGAYFTDVVPRSYCREMPDLPALSRNFCTLPVAVFGSSCTKLTHCGVLK